ncbi:helix-turn-helix domain-containing protein [Flavonifractor plautii]|uniref:Helix-turn-helix transcriptional regulator n=1 Tax=Flavonifractor plautii TaxID=292800 RepID=A0AAW6CD50_FLAPL|nr:helix-turn-helix transcriptional regulator [Flavonifractor plautii]MDB7873554.1 helix-turn-helix transcriptional regulator [Flavonifractor plautii]MDB7927723.1 helix-turn-helix transcriptional regulator [Flavonifractor plautii]MDB7932481.1 helix-turn-helix transcriptional regulator [Flavonifractor plautii]MDB7937716.1 helix-turn-helix transcriptional regulator [Flavonifractor plautii]
MFFDIFKLLCEKKGVSPKKATEDIGLSNSITTKWKKTGATPKGDTLQRIADYFGVTTDYLLTGEETKKAPTQEGERKVSDDDIKFALWGTREIDDDVLDRVRQFAKFAQENEKNK